MYNHLIHGSSSHHARVICAELNPYSEVVVTADECYMFGDIMLFLWDNPTMVTKKRGKKEAPTILLEEGIREVAQRWVEGRRQIVSLSMPQTIVDPAVEAIMKVNNPAGFSPTASATQHLVEEFIKGHYLAMAAENVIGSLLEKYIASEMEHYGWTWCAGEIVRAVDFLKKTDTGFVPLQVKNRSNSENSSSAAVRNGTDIIKWHRLDARTGKTHWDRFPEPELIGVLTEENFQSYIKENLNYG